MTDQNIPLSSEKFLHNIIDYAGLFPPASLSLANSFDNYSEYLRGKHNWMLSKFICPFSMTEELSELVTSRNSEQSLRLSLLAAASGDCDEFRDLLSKDVSNFKKLRQEFHGKSFFESMEIKVPESLVRKDSKKELSLFLDHISEIIRTNFEHRIFIFCELPATNNIDSSIHTAVKAISLHNEKYDDAGFKLRTGGTKASEIPEPETVVTAIRQCLDHKVAMKFTAGMHHPVRYFDASLDSRMHGFINVFGAGIIAFRHTISDRLLKEMIADEDASDFIFSDEGFEWKEWKSDLKEIHGARNGLVLSFGSCSFDEPVEDLQELKLI